MNEDDLVLGDENSQEEDYEQEFVEPVNNTFLIFGPITDEVCGSACAWILAMNQLDEEQRPEELVIMINSVGGDLHSAFALIECMRGSMIPVATVGVGQIVSAGLMIFAAGHKGMRTITPTCSAMIHTYSTEIGGNHHAIINIIKELKWTNKRLIDFFHETTGLKVPTIKSKLLGKQDHYMPPEEVVKLGIADRIARIGQ